MKTPQQVFDDNNHRTSVPGRGPFPPSAAKLDGHVLDAREIPHSPARNGISGYVLIEPQARFLVPIDATLGTRSKVRSDTA